MNMVEQDEAALNKARSLTSLALQWYAIADGTTFPSNMVLRAQASKWQNEARAIYRRLRPEWFAGTSE